MKQLDMKPNRSKGRLITFCGLDGAGKSSMIDMLVDYLRNCGKSVFLTKQPTDWVRNSEIFRNFQDRADHEGFEYLSLSLMAAADRVQHVSQVVRPMLDQFDYVISDRYIYSCLANLHARGYRADGWLYAVSEYLIEPDVAFFIDVPVERAIERIRRRPKEKDSYIDPQFQEVLRDEYRQMATWAKCRLIDGTWPMRAEYAAIVQEVNAIGGSGNE